MNKIRDPYGIVSTVLENHSGVDGEGLKKSGKQVDYNNSFFYVRKNVAHLIVSYVSMEVETDDSGNEFVKRTLFSKENTYDVESKDLVEELTVEDLKHVSVSDLCEFCKQVIMGNEYLVSAMESLENQVAINGKGICDGYCPEDYKIQLYKLCVHRQDLMEQLLKTSYQMLFNAKSFMAINLDEKNIKKAVNLPKAVLDDLVAKKRENCVMYFNTLCDDGNDAVILNDFLNNLKTLTKRTRKVNEFITAFLNDLAEAKGEDSSMTVTEILRYVLHQTMYHNTWDMAGFVNSCQYFKDYTAMRMLWGVKDRYPNNIFEAHDLLMRNVDGYNDEDKEAFKSVAATLKHLEKVVVVNKGKDDEASYSFIIPNTVDDLILEGVNLHHCIGSWGKKIINGSTRIVFMRRTDAVETSLATLELNETLKVIQAKIAYNEDLPTELWSVVKTYERKLKP